MKDSTRKKIEESIKDLEDMGGLNNPEMKKVIANLKIALDNEKKSKK
jgi:hypothetical protein